MKNKYLYFLLCFCVLLIISCKDNDNKYSAERIVTEWLGKKISFPMEIKTSYIGKDILVGNFSKSYRILMFTDSTGCTSCKLKLQTWKYYMQEMDSIAPGSVDFLFYFQPKNKNELIHLFKKENFKYPVYIDSVGKINQLNNFPAKIEFQCFLLDHNNKVISIGNPTLNTKVWDLYKKIITQGRIEERVSQPITTINIAQKEIEIKNLVAGKRSSVTFTLKNTGNIPLLISHIDASCGCTTPSWDKKPIKSMEITHITVEVNPDNLGYFNKTIYVYTNTKDKIIPLKIKGMAI